jgi:hypothetical protein
MSDYKEQMMNLAMEAAEAQFGKDFYALTPGQQDELYRRAMDTWADNRAAHAEMLRDMARDKEMGL